MEYNFDYRDKLNNEFCVYYIKNKIDNKMYIGSTNRLKKRMIDHYNLLKNNKHHSKKLQNSWNKHGEKSFVFGILMKNINENELISEEQKFIDHFKTYINGFNILPIAGSSLGNKWTEENKIKYSTLKKSLNIGKKILQYNLNGVLLKEYNNIRLAAEENNIKNPSNIGLVCRCERKSAGGFIWRYSEKEEQEKYCFNFHIKENIECPHCNSSNIKKSGFYHWGDKKEQIYKCIDCKRRFNEKTNKPSAWNVKVERNKNIIDMFNDGNNIKHISKYFKISEITVKRLLKNKL